MDAHLAVAEALQEAVRRLEPVPRDATRQSLWAALTVARMHSTIAARGYGAVSEELFDSVVRLGDGPALLQLLRLLCGRWVYALTDGRMVVADADSKRFLDLAGTLEDPAIEALAHRMRGTTLCLAGSLGEARRHLDRAVEQASQAPRPTVEATFGKDTLAAALAMLALNQWLMGEQQLADRTAAGALARAEKVGDATTSGYVLTHAGGFLNVWSRRPDAVARHADRLLALDRPLWHGTGKALAGAARAMRGDLHDGVAAMRDGLAELDAVHAAMQLPTSLDRDLRIYSSGMTWIAMALGEAGGPEEGLAALTVAETIITGGAERWCEAEMHRVAATLHAASGRPAEASARLDRALAVARAQGALAWERRATETRAEGDGQAP